jgi:hypothetical protein
MNSNEQLDLQQVRLFKNILLALLEALVRSRVKFQPLAIAVAAEEFAAELRERSAKDFKKLSADQFSRPAADEDGEKRKSYPD